MCVCVCVPRSRLTTHNRANEIKRTQKYSGFLGLLSLSPSTGLLLHHALIIRVPVRDYVWKTQKSYNCHHRIIIRYTRATCHDIPVKILPFVLIIHSFLFFFFCSTPGFYTFASAMAQPQNGFNCTVTIERVYIHENIINHSTDDWLRETLLALLFYLLLLFHV